MRRRNAFGRWVTPSRTPCALVLLSVAAEMEGSGSGDSYEGDQPIREARAVSSSHNRAGARDRMAARRLSRARAWMIYGCNPIALGDEKTAPGTVRDAEHALALGLPQSRA